MILPVIWHFLLKIAGINLKFFSIPALLILFIYLFQYIGFPILYFQLDEYRARFVTDQSLVLTAFFYTSITTTLLIFGFIASRQHHGKLHWIIDHASIQNHLQIKKSKYKIVWVTLLIIGSSVLFFYLSKIGYDNIALFAIIDNTDVSTDVLRSNMGNNFEGKYHWWVFGMRDILIYLSISLYSYYLVSKSKQVGIIFLIIVLVTSFSLSVAIEKGPLVIYLLMLFFCYALISENKKVITLTKGMKIVVAVLSIQMIFYINFMNSISIGSAITSALSRIFSGQMQPAYHYLEIFPQQIDFLWGQSFPNPGGLLPFENFRLTVEVMNRVYPQLGRLGIVGSMPAIFWGEAYANFGLIGVIFIPFVIGYFVYYLNILLYKLKPNPFSIALVIYTAEYISRLSLTGFSGYFVNMPLILMSLTSFMVLFFVNNGKIALDTNK